MIETVMIGLMLLLAAGYLIYHYQGRPRPSDISSLAELRQRLADKQFTIVQFYAPL